jgi:hypothetical protein
MRLGGGSGAAGGLGGAAAAGGKDGWDEDFDDELEDMDKAEQEVRASCCVDAALAHRLKVTSRHFFWLP